MINGFENITHDLTEYELKECVPFMVKGLRYCIGEGRALTADNGCKVMEKHGLKMNPARWRKCVNFIRRMKLIQGLISTSKGYFVAENDQQIQKFIQSLQERIDAIEAVKQSFKQRS